MRILVTNDDGIHAPGLESLERIARALSGEVWVVAPETDQSGSAHSLSLSDPLRLREIGQNRFAVRGTPTDCVIMALKQIMPERPDLVLSGVNRGHNLAEDVTYSGTVAGAIEGATLGIPSIALSQVYGWTSRTAPRYDCAEAHGPDLVRRLLDIGIPRGSLLNVNFPDRAPDEVAGVAVTTQGVRNQEMLGIEARVDGRGNPYYWLAFRRAKLDMLEGTDLKAVADGWISVTPLRLDMTDHAYRERLSQNLGG